jgi:hypothetical protein
MGSIRSRISGIHECSTLKKLPKGYGFAVEIRNKNWLVHNFIEALRERGVGLALDAGL